MADINLNLKQTVSPKLAQRAVLLGRVKMAQAIQMKESEWARMISEVEQDPLYQELLAARVENQRVIRYKRHGLSGISTQFYEMQDANVVGGGGESPEALLNKKKHLLELIQKIGQDRFENYFLYRESALDFENTAKECGVSVSQVKELQDFITEMSVQAEFYHPSQLDSNQIARPTLIGQIFKCDDGTYSISFYSPHLARGTVEINHDALKKWQKDKTLAKADATRLRKYVNLLELSNLKQGAFWRVMDYLLRIQKEYFETRDETKLAPVSLRYVARTLQFAPSTISRVIGAKSVLLPWGHEVLVSYLMPGQREVVLSILEKILSNLSKKTTDADLAFRIQSEYGIKVSRRTVTACRHILEKNKD